HPFVGGMWFVVGARSSYSALYHKTGHNSMKRGVVVPAALDELQKVANVLRRQHRVHLQRYVAQAGVKQNIPAHLIDGSIFERLELLAFDLETGDPDRSDGQAVAVGWRERDAIDDVDSFGDLTKRRELAIELRLRRRANEELYAVAVWLPGNAD